MLTLGLINILLRYLRTVMLLEICIRNLSMDSFLKFYWMHKEARDHAVSVQLTCSVFGSEPKWKHRKVTTPTSEFRSVCFPPSTLSRSMELPSAVAPFPAVLLVPSALLLLTLAHDPHPVSKLGTSPTPGATCPAGDQDRAPPDHLGSMWGTIKLETQLLPTFVTGYVAYLSQKTHWVRIWKGLVPILFLCWVYYYLHLFPLFASCWSCIWVIMSPQEQQSKPLQGRGGDKLQPRPNLSRVLPC